MDYNNFDENNENIYTNFHDHEFLDLNSPSVKLGEDRAHTDFRPQCQKKWNAMVTEAIASVMGEDVIAGSEATDMDVRPKIFDQNSKRFILVDTGASRSVWPRADFPNKQIDPFKALRAVNNSTINTYGVQNIRVQISKKFNFCHDFILSEISQPVIGWDWLDGYCKWGHPPPVVTKRTTSSLVNTNIQRKGREMQSGAGERYN